ncbi:uncharacterized protein LOC102081515 isoform X20 [Oreochromis niloticus]|uniref:uncharacterized protein LOC102081515 isoform X19 n=1 Tax=Oreochromis niloticus TaxID=8128 RepID=UPI000DF3C255|nr:uncharacterized protein LOC102081515 isoform X19 [Oreochromis niloticus]XP_025759125.1 uncharacterized protein LOC102081515 isoform X20 [Oreochromis niloticus]
MLCFAAQKKNVMCKYEDLGAFWLDTTIFTFTWSMSAVEYVRRARTNLVRTLKGLTTVIVENLYQRGVFSEEEVSKINTERDDFDKNRGIVDTVIKGGEAACYEFLRIIDITRKRSTERPPSFLENTDSNSSSRDKFDLSYWISCFSFKEDTNMDVTYLQGPSPCHRYQQKLKSKAQKISERSWTQSKAVLFNKETSLSYSSLVLDTQGQASASKIKKSKIKKSRKVRTKKLKAHIPEDKQETSPSELLKTYERKILLVGKPGIGKTAVVHQMLKLWSEKDNKDIDYMFYFDMRETPNITEVHKLKDLLFCKFSEPDEGKDKVLEDLKNNADSVTIIFDGVADVPSSSTQSVVLELIQKTLLPEAKIIITCRPEVESADFLLDWDCLRVEVKGFSEQGIREYLSKNLSEEHFSKVLCNLELFSLCHVPMYALMVVACFSFEGTVFCPHPCTVTEIYLNILHFCNQRNVGKTSENEAVQCNAILSLAEAAFYATKGKNVNLTSLTQIDRCANLGFMNKLLIQAGPVQKKPLCAFLHYTIQEVFAALWLLKDPERIRSVVQQCLTDDIKHMKHLVPFLCGLLNEKNMDLLQFLFTSQHLRETSGWFFKHLVTTFVDCSDTEDCEIDLLFLCQCLYESQSAEACVYLLDKLDYSLDLSGETLNPQQCYAVSYIISQSKERKIQLNLEDTTVSKQGVRPLLGCLSKLQRTDFLSWQLWTICLLSEVEVDYISLLCFAENQLHLSVNSQTQLYDRAGKVLQKSAEKVKVCLHWDHRSSVYQSVSKFLLLCLPNIHSLSVDTKTSDEDRTKFFVNLFCAAAEREQQTGEKILELLSSVCTYQTFPFNERCKDDDDDMKKRQCDHLLDLYSKVKDCEAKTGLSVLPSLQSVFQSAPAVWFINLSERKTSILLEVLKLQPEKKQVELTQYTHKKSKIRSFLQCLPYISQLSVYFEDPDEEIRFFVNLFCAAAEREQQTGETILELLSSVCTFNMFPFDGYDDDLDKYRCDLLLDMCSDVKDCETKTGLSVLPSLQSVFQSAPAVWFINLSERKTSILLEVLKLQPEKKQVELTQYTHKKSKIRSFLQCLPYISQLSYSVYPDWTDPFEGARFFVNLFCAAAEREQQTGETILELLSSVCTYQTFPVNDIFINDCYRSDFLLDLYCHVKDYETKTGLSVLPSIQSVFQSAPAVWSINFIYTNFSILLEVLKLQSEKKQVELREWPEEEEEEDSVLRSFLQCLPYISQLSCDPDFFQSVCTSMSVRSREEAQQLKSLLQLLGFQLLLTGELHRKSCWSVGRVLKLCSSKVDLILTPSKMSARGAALLFRHTTQLHSLRLSIDMSLLLFQWVRRGRVVCPLAVEELSLVPKKARPSHRVMLRAVSSLASLLRYWTVARLDLTETCIPAQGLITLLLHDGPLTVKLSEESFQQLLCLLHEIQDKDLTLSFLSKVGGDLTSCCLNWELLHYLLQQSSAQTITVDLRKNFFLQEETTRLLPFLDRIVFKRPSPSFVMSSIRELYRAHDSHAVPSLLRSFGHVINLSSRELDSVDCAALIFILKHGDGVKLNLLWTSIPAEGVESILFMLDKVSHLSVDRNQLLRFIHCCAACDVQQEAASGLLRTLQHSLDLSCSSCVELPEEDQPEPLSLTADDCRAVSTILTHSSRDTQLDLRDCEVEDSVLDLLFPVLHRVRLRVSKTVLLQLLSLVPVNSERDTVRRAVSLCGALGGELDLSHSTLDQRACGALVQMLDSCEGLTELDLSHCQLTDQLLLPLITHLHKVQVLDLSHNQITDASTDVLLQLLSINPSIDCVRLYSNNIVHRAAFKEHKQFEVW